MKRTEFWWRRVAGKVYEVTHPEDPWISPGAIRHLESNLQKKDSGFEWGSGRSTCWLGARLGKLTSVEHNEFWHRNVLDRIARRHISNIELIHVPLDHSENLPTRPDYDPVPRYVNAIAGVSSDSLGLVFVDGHYRQACIKAALTKLRIGGLLLVDDTWWLPLVEWGVPKQWAIVHQSDFGLKHTTIWERRS